MADVAQCNDSFAMTVLQDKLEAPLAAVFIAGATASGKSALAVAVARLLDGVVVNADSMQMYRDLAVLTARPTQEQMAQAPHRLYGVLDGRDPCSAGRFVEMARAEAAAVWAAGQIPIFVGGTGLYFRALEGGIAPMPDVDPGVRAAVRAELDGVAAAALPERVAEVDPDLAANLTVVDRQRAVRALEVFRQTGVPLSVWQKRPGNPVVAGRVLKLVVDVERAELYRRCDARFVQMIADGAEAEVRALLARGLDPALPVMKAVGVPELAAVERGALSLDAAVTQAQTATRRLAKRQLTWIRSNMITWEAANPQYLESLEDKIFTFIRQGA